MCTVDDIKAEAALGEFSNVQPAFLLSGSTETFALVDQMKMAFKVNYGSWQSVVFDAADFNDIGAATSSEVAASILSQVSDIESSDLIGKVSVQTEFDGVGAQLEVLPGDANSVLNFPLVAEGVGVGDSSIIKLIGQAICKLKGLENCGCFCKAVALWVLHHLYVHGFVGPFSANAGKIGVGEVKSESLGPASRSFTTAVDYGFGKFNYGDLNSTPYGAQLKQLLKGITTGFQAMCPSEPLPPPCL